MVMAAMAAMERGRLVPKVARGRRVEVMELVAEGRRQVRRTKRPLYRLGRPKQMRGTSCAVS